MLPRWARIVPCCVHARCHRPRVDMHRSTDGTGQVLAQVPVTFSSSVPTYLGTYLHQCITDAFPTTTIYPSITLSCREHDSDSAVLAGLSRRIRPGPLSPFNKLSSSQNDSRLFLVRFFLLLFRGPFSPLEPSPP